VPEPTVPEPAVPEPAVPEPAVPEPAPAHRRWGRWLLGGLALLLGLAALGTQLLDPWLRRTLEKQVSRQTHGQYRLRVGSLRTSLWQRAVRLRHLRLRPAAAVADTLPRLCLDVARLRLTGVGLWALLRRQVVPIDSLVMDSVRLQVLALPRRPARGPARPPHQQLPLQLPGLRLSYLGLRHARAAYTPDARPTVAFRRGDLVGHDLLLSAAGAADTQRLAYAAGWQLALADAQATVAGHRLALGALRYSTATRQVGLDSLRIRPPAPGRGRPGAVRITLALPRLRLAGLRAAAWQHQHRFRADSLLIDRPDLSLVPPAQPPPDLWKLLAPLARRADLAHLAVRGGQLRIAGLAHAPTVAAVRVTGTGLRIDSAAQGAPGRIFYARAWAVRTGAIAATVEAPFYRARSAGLRLSTAAGTLRLLGLALVPAVAPAAMNRRLGYQIPQFTVRVPELAVAGLDFAALAGRGQVRAARVTLRRPFVRIASDGRGPINPHQSIVTPEAMRRVSLRLDVRRLDLVGGTLQARYRSPLSPVVGRIDITRFTGTLRNLSNDPRRQTAARPLTGRATAYLQNRCRMTVNLAVPLLDPAGRHRVWGSFGPAPFAILNPMTVPTRLVNFKQGDVQHIDFRLQADQQQVTGAMTTRYTGLQLELLSYKQGRIKRPLLKRVVSKAANVLVIRDQNPRQGGRVVSGDMTSRRERRFSVFVLWRQGIVSGLLNNIGLPQALAQKIGEAQDVAPLPAAGR